MSRKHVSRSQIRAARTADLYGYLTTCHATLVRRTGQCLYLKEKDSVYIKKGIPGFMDFASGNHGNAIDFLVQYLNYRFVDAVLALTEKEHTDPRRESKDRAFRSDPGNFKSLILPPCAPGPFLRLHAYLQRRGIPEEWIAQMENRGILYQEADHGNAIFINPQRDYCEIRGTCGGSQNHFHSCRKTSADRFWYILNEETRPQRAFLCESAIDAVSLMLLHMEMGISSPFVYVSIGGVYNQKAIDRVKRSIPSVLAVDHDDAGEACRQRNCDLPFLIPSHKDWNEDLQYGIFESAKF